MNDLAKLIGEGRIIVCCGAGGVGKTTTSGAIALAAARRGRRVLALTIDPSKRLAEALGVARNPPEPVALPQEKLRAAGVTGEGVLRAWMLDPKLVADEAVRRIVRNPVEVEKLLQNKIYQHVTTMVAGMHEYTAMQALYRFVTEGRYDLVVLDTPPSRHALDFLNAPGRLSRFLEGRIFKMFIPEQGRGLTRMAGGLVNRVLSGVLGEGFAGDLATFFGVFSGVLGTITRDVSQMREFLTQPDVAFLLVTSPAPAALEEALFFEHKTRELKLPFRGFVLNRSHALDDRKEFPGAPLLGERPTPTLERAVAKLAELAETERALVVRDQGLLADLRRRAGSEGFAVAFPTLFASEDELGNLTTLANHIENLA